LFGDFEEATHTIEALRDASIPGFSMRDVTLKSPSTPECADALGRRPVYIQIFSCWAPCSAAASDFWHFLGAGQFLSNSALFPIVPIPPTW